MKKIFIAIWNTLVEIGEYRARNARFYSWY